jgi:hypothetical protein
MELRPEIQHEPRTELAWLRNDLDELERNGQNYTACIFDLVIARIEDLEKELESN